MLAVGLFGPVQFSWSSHPPISMFFFVVLLSISSYRLLSGFRFVSVLPSDGLHLPLCFASLSHFRSVPPTCSSLRQENSLHPSRSTRSHVSSSFTAPEWFSSIFPCVLFLFHSATSYHFYLLDHFPLISRPVFSVKWEQSARSQLPQLPLPYYLPFSY